MTKKIIQTRKPTHPGAILREDVLPALNMSVSAFARNMGVSRQMVHGILAERTGITPEAALRLAALLGNGPQLWIDMQSRYDLWIAQVKLHEVLATIQTVKVHERIAI